MRFLRDIGIVIALSAVYLIGEGIYRYHGKAKAKAYEDGRRAGYREGSERMIAVFREYGFADTVYLSRPCPPCKLNVDPGVIITGGTISVDTVGINIKQ